MYRAVQAGEDDRAERRRCALSELEKATFTNIRFFFFFFFCVIAFNFDFEQCCCCCHRSQATKDLNVRPTAAGFCCHVELRYLDADAILVHSNAQRAGGDFKTPASQLVQAANVRSADAPTKPIMHMCCWTQPQHTHTHTQSLSLSLSFPSITPFPRILSLLLTSSSPPSPCAGDRIGCPCARVGRRRSQAAGRRRQAACRQTRTTN
jgi:hypothetical protein